MIYPPTIHNTYVDVDPHPGGVSLRTLAPAGPVLARPVVVPAARRRRRDARLRGRDRRDSGTSYYLRFVGTLVESVELPHIRVR